MYRGAGKGEELPRHLIPTAQSPDSAKGIPFGLIL
jgi:hypothetical protein